jgi:deoxycytidine triphosphate deaminase
LGNGPEEACMDSEEKKRDQYLSLRANLDDLKKDPDPTIWETWQGAVLLKNEIERYCQDPIKLITPFDPKYLKPAAYHLRLGKKCRVDGKDYELSENNRVLRIPQHSIAIVRTLEWLNIPGFLVARWNLRVKMVYKGLVWVGSLQVDSGYQGYLMCPLYNLSNKEQELVYEEPLFTIDFVKTTRFDETKGCKLWAPQPTRPVDNFDELDYQRLESAPASEFRKMKAEMDKSVNTVQQFQSRIDNFQAITFTVIGIIVAALAFVSVSQFTDMSIESPSQWQITTWIVVLLSILVLVGVLAYAGLKILKRK